MSDNVTVEPDMILIWTLREGMRLFLPRTDFKKKQRLLDNKEFKMGSDCLWTMGVSTPSHPIHVFGAGVGSEHREDPRAAADIQDDFIFEHVLVVVHGVPVGQCPHLVLQHLLFESQIIGMRVRSCDA